MPTTKIKNPKYEILTESFTSKKAIGDKIKSIVASYDDYKPLSSSDQSFMIEFFNQFYPNGKSYFEIEDFMYICVGKTRNRFGKGTRCFFMRVKSQVEGGGAKHRFNPLSWSTALNKPRTENGELDEDKVLRNTVLKGLRTIVRKQTMQFRLNVYALQHATDKRVSTGTTGMAKCQASGKLLDKKQLHTDHIGCSFIQLVKDFMETNGLTFEKIPFDITRGGAVLIKNKDIALKWAYYHKCHAKFKLIEGKLNMSMGSKKH